MDGCQLTGTQKEVLDQRVLSSLTQPASERPRLYGSNTSGLSWLNSIEQYDQECLLAQSQSDLGTVQSFKSMWQRNTVDNPIVNLQKPMLTLKNRLIHQQQQMKYKGCESCTLFTEN